MGFLKRIFSIGSKKSKKRAHVVHNVGADLRIIEEEHEATVGRLLRSSSARFAVVSELDYTSLPPLPHPINEVIQTPATSAISIASTSVSQRGTYNVTVHGRKQHTAPEYLPSTNEDCISKPEHLGENCQLLGLRSDPSVASLLNMYDEHGRISPTAFSNSPPSPRKRERVQTRRNGSTLRQLLGNPSSISSRNGTNAVEGDISWAERFLGETETISSTSSLGYYPPNTPNTPLPYDDSHPHDVHDITTILSDYDLSTNAYEPLAISSMEVELSMGAESVILLDDVTKSDRPEANSSPVTPRRASQVFDFLTNKCRIQATQDNERSLPELPSAFSFSSNEDPSPEARSHFSDISSDSIYIPSTTSAIPPHADDITTTFPTHTSEPPHVPYLSPPNILTSSPAHDKLENEIEVIMTVPTKVIVTAPTPSSNGNITNYRAPRGPRSHSRRVRSSGSKQQGTVLANRNHSRPNSTSSVDPFTPIPPRRKGHRRSVSQNSSISASLSIDQFPSGKTVNPRKTHSRSSEVDKENTMELSALPRIPATPLRGKFKTQSTPREPKSLFCAAVPPSIFRPPAGMTPSPASSSELSPVGRGLMMNLRQQRTRAREVDRERVDGGLVRRSVRGR